MRLGKEGIERHLQEKVEEGPQYLKLLEKKESWEKEISDRENGQMRFEGLDLELKEHERKAARHEVRARCKCRRNHSVRAVFSVPDDAFQASGLKRTRSH